MGRSHGLRMGHCWPPPTPALGLSDSSRLTAQRGGRLAEFRGSTRGLTQAFIKNGQGKDRGPRGLGGRPGGCPGLSCWLGARPLQDHEAATVRSASRRGPGQHSWFAMVALRQEALSPLGGLPPAREGLLEQVSSPPWGGEQVAGRQAGRAPAPTVPFPHRPVKREVGHALTCPPPPQLPTSPQPLQRPVSRALRGGSETRAT